MVLNREKILHFSTFFSQLFLKNISFFFFLFSLRKKQKKEAILSLAVRLSQFFATLWARYSKEKRRYEKEETKRRNENENGLLFFTNLKVRFFFLLNFSEKKEL